MPSSTQVRALPVVSRLWGGAFRLSTSLSSADSRRFSVQADHSVKKDTVHYAIENHEYGGAACFRDNYTNKGTYSLSNSRYWL